MEEILRHPDRKGLSASSCNTNRGHTPLPDAEIADGSTAVSAARSSPSAPTRTPPDYVGCAIAERQELLLSCGFRYFTTFQKGKPDFTSPVNSERRNTTMKIAIGCDHGGYLLKQDILSWLEEHELRL